MTNSSEMELNSVVLGISGTLFFFMCHFIARTVIESLCGGYLSDGKVYVITCRFVSGLQGAIASLVGYIIASSCTDVMSDVHWLTNAYVYFGTPYFAYDTWAMYAYFTRLHPEKFKGLPLKRRLSMFLKSNKLMVFHHICLPSIIYPVVIILRNNRGDFFFGVFYMIELVVPLISAREILGHLDLKKSAAYFYVSLAMVVMFFICRLAVFPYLYYCYAIYARISVFQVPANIPIKCNFCCTLILLPQIYWFGLMLRGLYRVYLKLNPSSNLSKVYSDLDTINKLHNM